MGTSTTVKFQTAPSNIGGYIQNSSKVVNSVFSRRNGIVYIYSNTGVLTTIPQKNFVKFKAKNEEGYFLDAFFDGLQQLRSEPE